MYENIIQSLEKALAQQRWNAGDRFHRIGNPFEWGDAGINVCPSINWFSNVD
jgi:hypothetical protein